MGEITLFDAWGIWLCGNIPTDTVLWGKSLLFWGRAGKIAQCIGGTTILAEIIGTERLRTFGKSLHGIFTLVAARDLLRHTFAWFKLTMPFFVRSDAKNRAFIAQSMQYHVAIWNLLVCLLLALYWILVFIKAFPAYESLAVMYFVLLWAFSVFTIGPIVIMAFLIMGSLFGLAADLIFFEPLAFLLEKPSLERIVKIIALFLLVVGFHFDLLAS